MKKLSVFITCLFILFGSTFSVVAEEEDAPFVPSIGYKSDIYVPNDDELGGEVINTPEHSIIKRIEGDVGDVWCEQEIVITPYSHKETIKSDQSRKEIDICFDDVKKAATVCTLAPVVEDYIEVNNPELTDEDLVFTNIFDITTYFDEHGLHDEEYDHSRIYKVKVGANTLKNFVCLLHYDYKTDSYELVKDCVKISEDTLKFTFPNSSPFVVVAYVGDGVNKAKRDVNGGGSGSDYYKAVNTQTGEGLLPAHRCIVDIGGTCYCLVVVILLVLSVFLNIYLILKRHEKK